MPWMMISLCMLGNYDFMIFNCLMFFFKIIIFKKNTSHEYHQTVWKQIRPYFLVGPILLPKGYLQAPR